MTEQLNGVRTYYLRDSENYERVLTIVTRRNDDGTADVGWSVNLPGAWVDAAESKTVIVSVWMPGDQFSRKQGRKIALNRLNATRTGVSIKVNLAADGTSIEPAMRYLTQHCKCSHVRRMADEWIQSQRHAMEENLVERPKMQLLAGE